MKNGEVYSGTIDIPSQGAAGLALSNIEVSGASVAFVIAGVPGNPTFKGTVEGDAMNGAFTQSGMSIPFELRRGEAVKKTRPQDPKPPLPYREEEVRVQSGGFMLAGTLTLPPGEGPFPAAVLITGSGPQNRDEELMDHRPFRVLADHLTRAGIAVLRCDDRGVGASEGKFAGATTRDFADDAEAQVRYLKGRKEIREIGLIGHSEGGLVAPIVAARNSDVKFVVMLAGPGINGRDTLISQNRIILEAHGAGKEQVEAVVAAAAALFDAVLADKPKEQIRALAKKLIEAQTAGTAQADAVEQMAGAAAEEIGGAWYREFLGLQPREALEKVRVPVLALNGELDTQVTAENNLREIGAALKTAGNTDVTTRAMPGLNHLFQRATTGLVDEYIAIEETMNPAALDAVRDWILERFGEKK